MSAPLQGTRQTPEALRAQASRPRAADGGRWHRGGLHRFGRSLRRTLVAGAVAAAQFGVSSGGFAQPAPADQPIFSTPSRVLPAFSPHGMVVSQEARATRVGVDILEAGGNAVDAAVAVGFALAVTLPRAGNLGGGGFMVLWQAEARTAHSIDYRETAPAAATPAMFIGPNGVAEPRLSRDTGLGVGVPGTVAGLALAHAKYGSGRFTLAELIAPAIRLARDGFTVDADLAESLPRARGRLARWPASARVFLSPAGEDLGLGDRLVQRDLGRTLERIARQGPAGFYEGETAEAIAASVRAAGGVMTAADLAAYRAVERAPVRGHYRGLEVISMPPPSSGGVHLVQILNMLEGFDLAAAGPGSARALHVMIEAMKLAYADRARHLGDPGFVRVPVAGLVSRRYAAELAARIAPDRATPSSEIEAGTPQRFESEQTTHYSVVDRHGNAVSNTYTLNFSYGLGLVADGTGVLLNNELDDFAAAPDAPNAYGLVGGEANAPAAGKRPLSSMTPTIVLRNGKAFLVTGSPGGSRIITTVLQVLVNRIDHGMSIGEAVVAPRLHHQWFPDEVRVERGFSPDTLDLLRQRGHRILPGPTSGSASTIEAGPDGFLGFADTRQRGTLAEGPSR